MSDHLISVTDENFEKEVLQSDLPVLVDFWGTYCMPCKKMLPILEQAALQYDGKVKFVKIEVDNNRETAVRHKIQAVPTFILFKAGEAISSRMGMMGPSDINQFVSAVLEDS